MSWTPSVGMILKHKTVSQKIILESRKEFGATPFWMVSEYDKYGKPIPWMIGEKYLTEQYNPPEANP